MELRHLRYFIAVAETGSLTEAAERRLHTSQPSLSRQIRDLEYQVGVELLSRGVRGVELTAAGHAFLDHARLALAQVDAAGEAARPFQDDSKGFCHMEARCDARGSHDPSLGIRSSAPNTRERRSRE
jgi:LysR family transcriptional regulator, hca operon transcriptional activator